MTACGVHPFNVASPCSFCEGERLAAIDRRDPHRRRSAAFTAQAKEEPRETARRLKKKFTGPDTKTDTRPFQVKRKEPVVNFEEEIVATFREVSHFTMQEKRDLIVSMRNEIYRIKHSRHE